MGKSKVSESIFSNDNVVIPMADVQHVEKRGKGRGGLVITCHTGWDTTMDFWANPIHLPDKALADFLKAWCYYRHELEGK